MTVPAPAAARATATSPPGCTACTPVGEMRTGKLASWPMTVVASSRAAGSPATCGRKRSSENALTLSFIVTPASAPASTARYTDRGSRRLARRCASATVSNQSFVLAISGLRSAPQPAAIRQTVTNIGRIHARKGATMAENLTAETAGTVTVDDDVLADDVLVEEVSIDGMCGVY